MTAPGQIPGSTASRRSGIASGLVLFIGCAAACSLPVILSSGVRVLTRRQKG
jgi:hypothetical protein